MTNRADELRRLADRVERANVHDKGDLNILRREIIEACDFFIEEEPWVRDALSHKSVDAAKQIMPEKRTPINAFECKDGWFLAVGFTKAKAQDEAHARLALALRVRAEMEESG